METTEILLILNSLLLTLIGFLFFSIGFFLKDLHGEFKNLISKVNEIYTTLHSHITDQLSKVQLFQFQINNLQERVKKLEDKKTSSDN